MILEDTQNEIVKQRGTSSKKQICHDALVK